MQKSRNASESYGYAWATFISLMTEGGPWKSAPNQKFPFKNRNKSKKISSQILSNKKIQFRISPRKFWTFMVTDETQETVKHA